MAERTCIGCGAEFSPNGPNQRYCTKACKKANAAKVAKPKPAYRECLDCTRLFKPKRWDQECCNAKCGKHYINNVRRRRFTGVCVICGSEFVAIKPSRVCTGRCVGLLHKAEGTGINNKRNARRATAVRKLRRAQLGYTSTFIRPSGPCSHCGTNFTGTTAHASYCSKRCAWAAQAKRYGASPKHNKRLRVLMRDHWTCWICGGDIDPELFGTGEVCPEYPSVDHVIERDAGGSNDEANLRAAHMGCNSSRGGRYLAAKAGLLQAGGQQLAML